ncbi:MAG: hypothetical protein K9I74_04045 [Bacteroidales bacterium]|nr:hypothetical protein [Bacteroidales bacterium]
MTFILITLILTHLIIHFYHAQYPNNLLLFSSYLVMSVISGLFLVMFNGRIDNYHINPHWTFKTALYLLSFVIVIWSVLRIHNLDNGTLRMLGLYFSAGLFYLKTLMILFIIWLYKSNRLTQYLIMLYLHQKQHKTPSKS